MPVARMKMRPWLQKMIDSKAVSGVNWVDKDKTMFSIPWKHAARHGWELEKDASLFKMWAIHTGKYAEGQTCDPKTWKANFRCAMNSLPDIEEVKDKSINKGHQAMRVFRMLPITPKSRDKRSKMGKLKHKKVKLEEDSDSSDVPQSPIELPYSSPQDNRVDSTMHTEQHGVTYVNAPGVPDWSFSVDIESEPSFCHRFEVSPAHSTCPDDYSDIIEICEQLERETDAQWSSSSLDNKGFLCNEACTSPGSQWSEASSADELEELPQYITLGSNFSSTTDDLWNSFCQGLPPIL